MKENGKKQTIYRRNYHLALLADSSAQVESLLHCLKQSARGIGLYVNSDKTAFKCFNQDGAISS